MDLEVVDCDGVGDGGGGNERRKFLPGLLSHPFDHAMKDGIFFVEKIVESVVQELSSVSRVISFHVRKEKLESCQSSVADFASFVEEFIESVLLAHGRF